jgi:hypothetical protein
MNFPFKVNEREKKFLIFGAVGVVLIVLFQAGSWYSDMTRNTKDLSASKIRVLEKQLNKISLKASLEKTFKSVKQELDRQEKEFLRGGKPPVAAATLQRSLKEMASSLNINVKQERTLNPVDADGYLGIPVEIGFQAKTAELKKLLVSLRQSSYLLIVSEMKIRVTNIRKPVDVYTTLVVTGFIKKETQEDSKEAKNVS